MNKKYDLTNQTFNKLTVLKRVENSKDGQTRWLCKCECGNETIVWGGHLRSGHTKSCGCLNKEACSKIPHKAKHGLHATRIYKIWNAMKVRCNNPYKNYGERGITVCKEWEEFQPFYNWAMENGYQDNLTIDRIDVNGNYEPSNCRWATMEQQQNNKRTNRFIKYKGKTHTVSEWSKILKINPHLIVNRLKRGWEVERALNYGE